MISFRGVSERYAHPGFGDILVEISKQTDADNAGIAVAVSAGNIVEVFFDCSSPWTYLAFDNIIKLEQEFRFKIVWRPILVGAVFNAINPSVYQARSNPIAPKEAYLQKDLEDWCVLSGLSIRFPPSVFPVNSARAMRACIVADGLGLLPEFARAVFVAYWRDDLDISDVDNLRMLCEAMGIEPERFFGEANSAIIRATLKHNVEELIARGGFGSPTMFVNGNDMYFGNDRMTLGRRALTSPRSSS